MSANIVDLRKMPALEISFLLCTIGSTVVAQIPAETFSASAAITGAPVCFSRTSSCILLKVCDFQLLNVDIFVGACFQGTTKLVAHLDAVPPVFGFTLTVDDTYPMDQCGCGVCSNLCSNNHFNTSTTNEEPRTCPKPSDSSAPSSAPPSAPPSGSASSQIFDDTPELSVEFQITVDVCIAVTADSGCMLAKFCDDNLDYLEEGPVFPPACLTGEASVTILNSSTDNSTNLMQVKWTTIENQYGVGPCNCFGCVSQCACNLLVPVM